LPLIDGSGPPADPRLLTFAARLVPTAALLTIGMGAVALTGWLLELDVLKRVLPDSSSMKPNTAACLILLGLSLLLTTSAAPARRRAAVAACTVVLAVAAATLTEYATGLDLALDRALFATATASDTIAGAHPGRPAPNTAATFVLLAAAQLLVLIRRDDRTVLTAQILSLTASVVGLLGIYGYAFRVSGSESFLGLTGMAVHTAAAVLLTATATFYAHPRTGLARLLTAQGASAMLTRRMLIATTTVPPLLGAVCLYGQDVWHLFDPRLAVALLVAGNVIVFAVVSFVAGTRAARLEAARDHSELLLAGHTKLQAVVDRMPASIFMKDMQGRYALVNEAFEKMLDPDHGTALGHTDDELFDEATAARLHDYANLARTAGQPIRFEHIVSRQGRPMTYLSEVFVLRDPVDHPYAICGVLTDISERKQAELQIAATAAELQDELVHRQRVETELRAREAELTAFAYEVAHDLRGPLTPIGGFARILADDLAEGVSDATELVPTVEHICRGVDRMERLIGDLLSYATARDGAFHPEPVDLQDMVAAIIAERTDHLRTASPVLFPDIRTGPLPDVRADPVLCRQLLDNLIGNALKYTYPGRSAHVAISGQTQADGWVRVEIADQGIGIPADDQDRVFTSFHRVATETGYAGSGLGLAICRRVIDRHHGTIEVGDNPGGGSQFTFTLPGLQLATPIISSTTGTGGRSIGA
jgi:PAS domain S-box-containing protein